MNENLQFIQTDLIGSAQAEDGVNARTMSVGLMLGGFDHFREIEEELVWLPTEDRLIHALDRWGKIPTIGTPMRPRNNAAVTVTYNAAEPSIADDNLGVTEGWVNRHLILRVEDSENVPWVTIRWVTKVDGNKAFIDKAIQKPDGTGQSTPSNVQAVMPPAVDPSLFFLTARSARPQGDYVLVELTYMNFLYVPQPVYPTRIERTTLQYDEDFEARTDPIVVGWVPPEVDGEQPPTEQSRHAVDVEMTFSGREVPVIFRSPAEKDEVLEAAVGHVNRYPFMEGYARQWLMKGPSIQHIAGSRRLIVSLPFHKSMPGDAHDRVAFHTLPDGRFVPNTEILDEWQGEDFRPNADISSQWAKNGVQRIRAYPRADFSKIIWDAYVEDDTDGIFLPEIVTKAVK